ncbi:hypothetical protein M501DRAFT_1005677 [Patellaria atrata CBS 101060]|uniref:gamma-glutamylcyclotransferase n=1 Tax=Patellaria atrata CBS 101060 TaxID=1346257 RepID=A0A9P4SHE4_9PEZI|nr:hypothetical protein M501DRAFT_1005677 [Patellaria atrata CBS 101060]
MANTPSHSPSNLQTLTASRYLTELPALFQSLIPQRLQRPTTPPPPPIPTQPLSHYHLPDSTRRTVLYLAYGSNLSHETFQGVRGIRPLSQLNVQVPSLRLTFDLPFMPYHEPCFANTALRDPSSPSKGSTSLPPSKDHPANGSDYHKDRWHKGLIGVVYEVTPSDYAHIIATEGGGSSYADIIVPCHPLPLSPVVPSVPTTPAFKAHTLFAPRQSPSVSEGRLFRRPDPSYAQPSARYLKLITDGAAQHGMPAEYLSYLAGIRPYTRTTRGQEAGRVAFLTLWMPFFAFLFALGKIFADPDGMIPGWLAQAFNAVVVAMWASYDNFFVRVFGDGERTVGDGWGEELVFGP